MTGVFLGPRNLQLVPLDYLLNNILCVHFLKAVILSMSQPPPCKGHRMDPNVNISLMDFCNTVGLILITIIVSVSAFKLEHSRALCSMHTHTCIHVHKTAIAICLQNAKM